MQNAKGNGHTLDYHVGDIVQVAVDPEARSWGFKAPPDGTRGTIDRFEEITYGRFNTCGRGSGVFQNRSYMKVKLADGTLFSCGTHHLAFVEPGPRTIPNREYLRPLPETSFWEGDIVRYHDTRERQMPLIPGCGPDAFMVHRVNYDDAEITYDISYNEEGGWSFPMRQESQLQLIRRGRVWNFFHGEPVEFQNQIDYGRFLASVVKSETIRNGNSWLFDRWDAERAVQLCDGDFHSKNHTNDRYEVHKLGDERLVPAVRETFLSTGDKPRTVRFPRT
jgi:hypothetical protein